MTAPEVPPGVPVLLSRGEIARVTGLSVVKVKLWLDRNILKSIQPTGRSGKREVHACELARVAAEFSLPLDWDAVREPSP